VAMMLKAMGKIQGDAIRNLSGSSVSYTAWSINPSDTRTDRWDGALGISFTGAGTDGGNLGGPNENQWRRVILDASRQVPTANENRPVNMAVRYIIRAVR